MILATIATIAYSPVKLVANSVDLFVKDLGANRTKHIMPRSGQIV